MSDAKVTISNQALARIGVASINSMTEASEPARKCNAIYNQSLDYMLQLFPWNFAIVRETLAVEATGPEFEYSYQYQLPTDPYCIKVIEVYGGSAYKIEGRKLLSNESSIDLIYIKRVTDMSELSSAFKEAFISYLASLLAFPLTKSTSLKREMDNSYRIALAQARLVDSQEDTPDSRKQGTWVTARTLGQRTN